MQVGGLRLQLVRGVEVAADEHAAHVAGGVLRRELEARRVRDVGAEVQGRDIAVVAEVEGKAVHVGRVELHRRAHRLVQVGVRIAGHEIGLDRVAELVAAGQHVLTELRRVDVDQALGAHVDAVELAVVPAAGLVEVRVQDGSLRLAVRAEVAAERDRPDVVVVAPVRELAVHEVEIQLAVGVAPLVAVGDAGALVIGLRAAVARDARRERARAGRRIRHGAAVVVGAAHHVVVRGRVRRARHAGAAGRRRDALHRIVAGILRRAPQRRAEAAVHAGAVQFHGLVAFLGRAPLRVCGRQQRADLAVCGVPAVRQQCRDARLRLLRQRVAAFLAAQAERAALEVERARRAQIDGGAERAFLDVGLRRLAHFEAVEQFRREHRKIEAASAVGAAVDVRGARRRDALDAVDAHACEAGVQAAHGDLLAFAAVAARQRHAGHALQRLGQVRVGELGDVLGLDDVDDAVAVLLRVQRAVQAGAKARHDDDAVGRLRRRIRARIRRRRRARVGRWRGRDVGRGGAVLRVRVQGREHGEHAGADAAAAYQRVEAGRVSGDAHRRCLLVVMGAAAGLFDGPMVAPSLAARTAGPAGAR